MPVTTRTIGFVWWSTAFCFQRWILTSVIDRSLVPIWIQFILPFRDLPFRVPTLLLPSAVAPELPPVAPTNHLPGFWPSSRHHEIASTHAGHPMPPLRSALRFSQPLDGFLREIAPGLISSRATSRVLEVQGLLPSHSASPSSGRAAPLPLVSRRPLMWRSLRTSNRHGDDTRLRGLVPCEDAFRRRERLSHVGGRFPLPRSAPPGHRSSP